MSDLKTVIGACPAAMDSNLDLSVISLSVSVTGSASYDDPSIPISQSSEIQGSVDRTWNRVPLPYVGQEFGAPAPPGEDGFYLIQYKCACCRCRYALSFDDGNVPVPENNAEGVPIGSTGFPTGAPTGAGVPINVADFSGFDPPPDDPPDMGLGIFFWNHNAPPCKKADGTPPVGWPYFLYVAMEDPGFPPFAGDVGPNVDSSVSVSGTDGVTVIAPGDAPSPGIGFYATFNPVACELSHTYSLSFTHNLTFSNDDTGATQSFSSTITVDLTIGGSSGNSGDGGLATSGLTTGNGLTITGLTSGGLDTNTNLSTGLTTGSLSTDSLD